MDRSGLSLKWLEIFQAVARLGSLRAAAARLGVSVSTASHHLSCLEEAVGAPLLDHSRRPMRLTPAGEVLLRRVDDALSTLRRGVAEIWSEDLASIVRVLRLAHIEDFDLDVGPALVDRLSCALPLCDFSILSRPTHEVMALLQADAVDIGIASSVEIETGMLLEQPVVRDPFVLALPAKRPDLAADLSALRDGAEDLPLMRHSRDQLLGRRIEAQLRRMDLRFPERMEFESTYTVLSMVAAGHGFAVTTALTYARARRYHEEVRLLPFPGKAFSRQISVFSRADLPPVIPALLLDELRTAVRRLVVEPTVARHPWLADSFALVPEAA